MPLPALVPPSPGVRGSKRRWPHSRGSGAVLTSLSGPSIFHTLLKLPPSHPHAQSFWTLHPGVRASDGIQSGLDTSGPSGGISCEELPLTPHPKAAGSQHPNVGQGLPHQAETIGS